MTKDTESLKDSLLFFNHKKNPQIVRMGIRLADIVGFKVDNRIVSIIVTTSSEPIVIYERITQVEQIIRSHGLIRHFSQSRSVILSLYFHKCLLLREGNIKYFSHLNSKYQWRISRYVRSVFYKDIANYIIKD